MNKVQLRNDRGIGDTAVDGLIAGLMAGVGMAIYLVIAGLLSSQGLVETLGLFDPALASNALTGTVAHLAVSAIYGVVFGLIMTAVSKIWMSAFAWSWLMGLLYGLVLFGLARGMLLTAVNSPLLQVTSLHFALAHLVYGLILGYWLGKK